MPAGYQRITVTGADGYIYLQKTLPFQANTNSSVAIINSRSGLDLLQIPDTCCPPSNGTSFFRVSNLAVNSSPMDVLLGDGRVVYANVRYRETVLPGGRQSLSFNYVAPSSFPAPQSCIASPP